MFLSSVSGASPFKFVANVNSKSFSKSLFSSVISRRNMDPISSQTLKHNLNSITVLSLYKPTVSGSLIKPLFSSHSGSRSFATNFGFRVPNPRERLTRLGLLVGGSTLLLYMAGGALLTLAKWITLGALMVIIPIAGKRWYLRMLLYEPWAQSKKMLENARLSSSGRNVEVPPISSTSIQRIQKTLTYEGEAVNVDGYRWSFPVAMDFKNQTLFGAIVSESQLDPSSQKQLLMRIYMELPMAGRQFIYEFGKLNPEDSSLIKQTPTYHSSQEYTPPTSHTSATQFTSKNEKEEVLEAEIVEVPKEKEQKRK